MKRLTLREQIDADRVQHLRFREVLETVTERIDAALNGGEPKFQAIAGPSRVGKSAVIGALKASYPETTLAGQRCIRVLFVDSPEAPSPKLLPRSVLKSLGALIPRNRSVDDLNAYMHEQLDLVGTNVIVFDEFSQLVEPGSRVSAEEAARWCKNVILKERTVVAAGVPRIERLLEADPQLKGRAYRTIPFRPYKPDVPDELAAHISVSLAYLAILKEHGWTIDPDQPLLANIYLHAPGLAGGVSDLIRELARQLQGKRPGVLTMQDFAAAAAALEPLGPADPAPFGSPNVKPQDLNNAYLHVVARNEAIKHEGKQCR